MFCSPNLVRTFAHHLTLRCGLQTRMFARRLAFRSTAASASALTYPFRVRSLATATPAASAAPKGGESRTWPITRINTENKGRCLIATEPIAGGTTVLIEEPIVTAPQRPPTARGVARPALADGPHPPCETCLASTTPAATGDAAVARAFACPKCGSQWCLTHAHGKPPFSHDLICGYEPMTHGHPTQRKFPVMAAKILLTSLTQQLSRSKSNIWSTAGQLCFANLNTHPATATAAPTNANAAATTAAAANAAPPAPIVGDYNHLIDFIANRALPNSAVAATTGLKLSEPALRQLLPLDMYTRAVGVLHLNCFSAYDEPTNAADATPTPAGSGEPQIGTALFYAGSFFNHSCNPNTKLSYRNGTGHFIATRAIGESEELTVAYVDLLLPTAERTSYLYRSYGFACHCERCVPI